MKNKAIRVHWLGLVVMMSMAFLTTGISNPNHPSGFTAKVMMADGAIRTIDVQGVGCSTAMCSRVFIRAQVDGRTASTIWFDSISSIKSVTNDTAVLVMKDGTERHITFIPDFRVLYFANPNSGIEKLDLRNIKSLEILPLK